MLACLFASSLSSLAKTNVTPVETPEQAEQRMAMIEAVAPPASNDSMEQQMDQMMSRLEKIAAETVRVTAALLDDHGQPILWADKERPHGQITTFIDGKDRSARMQHWEPGYAPYMETISLAPSELDAAQKGTTPEERTIVLPAINLTRGAPSAVRLRTSDSQPLSGAFAQVLAKPHATSKDRLPWEQAVWLSGVIRSDANGLVHINNLNDHDHVLLRVYAPGFIPEERLFENLPDRRNAEWILSPAKSLQGRVVDAKTGEPLPGVQIAYTNPSPVNRLTMHDWESLLNTQPVLSEQNGRFALSLLPPEWRGSAILRREGFADLHLLNLETIAAAPATTAIQDYAMKPGHRLAGILRVPKGFLRRTLMFSIDARSEEDTYQRSVGSLSFWYNQRSNPWASIDRLQFDPDATEIPFVFENLPEGRLVLSSFIDRHQLRISTNVTLDADRDDVELSVQTMGQVEVTLVSPNGEVLPVRGRLKYSLTDGRYQGCLVFDQNRSVAVVDGRASIKIEGEERLKKVTLSDSLLTGYRFVKRARSGGFIPTTFDLPAEGSTLRINMLVEPAGALRVRLSEDDGQSATDGKVRYHFSGSSYSTSSSASPPYAELCFSPIPLGEACELVVQRGRQIASTGRVTPTLDSPVIDQPLRFASGSRVTGRLLDSEGQPVAGGTVRIGYQYVAPQPSMLLAADEQTTGPDGTFTFEQINFDLPNPWWVETVPAPDGPPSMPNHRESIDAKATLPLSVSLPPVSPASGRLLDHETGLPVAGVEVAVRLAQGVSPNGRPVGWSRIMQPAAAVTDAEGRFYFHNLTAGAYEFYCKSGQILSKRDDIKAPAISDDERTWIDLLQVPGTCDDQNRFWYRPSVR